MKLGLDNRFFYQECDIYVSRVLRTLFVSGDKKAVICENACFKRSKQWKDTSNILCS